MSTSSRISRFCYLIQGRYDDINVLQEILEGREIITLTWDKVRPDSIFLPNSSWSVGRRTLCRTAIARGAFDYFVFMDGDAITTPAELDVFEHIVSQLKPAVAVPRVPKTEHYVKSVGKRAWVLAYESDEQFQCFDARIICDQLRGSPYVSAYDMVSWWYPCIIVQSLIRKYYWRSFIQINGIFVKNDGHGAYPKDYDEKFIHREVRRLGLSVKFPLSTPRRFTSSWYKKLTTSLDEILFQILCLLSNKLYRPFDPIRDLPWLSRELQGMIRFDS